MKTNPQSNTHAAGLVLPGGGARAAYQVGVLKAIADCSGFEQVPFRAIAGISAGAINAAGLAQHADQFSTAIAKLESVWGGMRTDDVFLMDYGRLQRFMGSSNKPSALLDNAPLKALLQREFAPERLTRVLANDLLEGLAITASNYTTGEATTFVQTAQPRAPWHRRRNDSVATRLTHEHLAASAALPVLFPPQPIDGAYYIDGSLRMSAPLSPAIRLGADRILVIGVRHEGKETGVPQGKPGLGEIAGYTLDSIFAENLNIDIERAEQINAIHRLLTPAQRRACGRRAIEVMVIRPSEDPRALAARHSMRLPRGIRLFLRTVGSWGHEWRLPSYLLFEGEFASALIDLGYRDGLKLRPKLEAFLGIT